MKTVHKNEETHSPEVREMLEKKPGWIIRWGTLVISLLVLAALFIGWEFFR
jgi:hypothetical protein